MKNRFQILLLLIGVLFGSALYAQPTITRLDCNDKRARQARITFRTDNTAGDAARVTFAYSNAKVISGAGCASDPDCFRSKQVNSSSTNNGDRNVAFSGLIPDSDVYIGDLSSDDAKTTWADPLCTATCTNCTSSDQSIFTAAASGCDCTTGEHPRFHTLEDDLDPTPDPPVTSAATTPPTPTVAPVVVASDCSDLGTKLSTAKTSADAGEVVEVVLPSGVACHINQIVVQNIAHANGRIYMHPDASPKLLPPPGTQLDKTAIPFLGILTDNAIGSWGYAYGANFIATVTNGRGYYFENIQIKPPALDDSILTPLTKTITAANVSTDVLTLDDVTGLVNGDTVVTDFTGQGIFRGHGIMMIGNLNVGAKTLKLYSGINDRPTFNGTAINLTGSSCSDGTCGTLRRFIALPISAHITSSGRHALTITGHGLANYPAATLTAGTSNTVTISGSLADYQIGSSSAGTPNAKVVLIQGTGVGNCDNLWNVTSAVEGTGVITIARSGVTPNCAGANSGTVRAQRAFSVFRTSSDTIGDSQPRAFNWAAADGNTIELLETAPVADVTGGWLFWDVEQYGAPISFTQSNVSNSTENVTFDRTFIGGCFPWRYGLGLINFNGTENVALVNSIIHGCSWHRINPVSNAADRIFDVDGSRADFYPHSFNSAQGLVLDNNFYWRNVVYNNDNSSGSVEEDVQTNDLTFTRNHVYTPAWTSLDAGEFRGHFLRIGFSAEFKDLTHRADISANYWKTWWSDFQQTAPALEFALNGSNNLPALCNGFNNTRIDNNVFDDGATVVQVGHSGRDANKMVCLTEKISFQNNLVTRTNTPKYNPGDASGHLWALGSGPLSDIVLSRVTFIPEKATAPGLIWFNGGVSSGGRFTDSILGVTEGDNQTRMGFVHELGTQTEVPAFTTATDGGYALWQAYFKRGNAYDSTTSSFLGNFGIPMLRVSSSGTYTTKSASKDAANAYCPDSIDALDKVAGLSGGGKLTWVGDPDPCPGTGEGTLVDSVQDRLNEVFEAGTWRPKGSYVGKGADLDAISDAMGFPGPVTVTGDHESLTLSYEAPDTTGCWGQVAEWQGSVGNTIAVANLAAISDWTQDTSGLKSQSIEFTGLSPATQYLVRVACRKTQVGLVTTAGAP